MDFRAVCPSTQEDEISFVRIRNQFVHYSLDFLDLLNFQLPINSRQLDCSILEKLDQDANMIAKLY